MAEPFEINQADPTVFQAALTTGERLFLSRLAGDVIELLGIDDSAVEQSPQDPFVEMMAGLGMDETAEVPLDPAVLRLLPQASDDPEVAAEFRRFTDNDLRQTKV